MATTDLAGGKLAETDYYEKTDNHVELFGEQQIAPWDQLAPQVSLVTESLVENNYAVLDTFIEPDEARSLKAEVKAYYADGRMIDGEIGRGADGGSGRVVEKMRTDKVLWLEGSEPHIKQYMRRHVMRMDIFTQKLACVLEALHPELSWEGAGRTKIMATCYPGNESRYVAHYDNPNRNGRIVTTILYLNEGWQPKDGGVLRMKTKNTTYDVAPLFNRLLVFWSDRRCPHEVLPAVAKERYAITIWWLDEKERREAIKQSEDAAAAAAAAAEKEKASGPSVAAVTAPAVATSPSKKSSLNDVE